MGTIAQKLEKIQNTKNSIAEAIRVRGGTVPSTFNQYPLAIQNLPKTFSTDDDVVFFNYKGELVASYTSAQAMALTAMPPTSLIGDPYDDYGDDIEFLNDGTWCYDISTFHRLVSSYGKLVVGGFWNYPLPPPQAGLSPACGISSALSR